MSEPAPEFPCDKLTIAQRLELLGLIWDSLTEDGEVLPLPEWHREELDRRLANADAAPEAGIPWEQVRARLREKP
jgi:putative addiction module component (TIGR02574 family)